VPRESRAYRALARRDGPVDRNDYGLLRERQGLSSRL
jgi:hypothetical protein